MVNKFIPQLSQNRTGEIEIKSNKGGAVSESIWINCTCPTWESGYQFQLCEDSENLAPIDRDGTRWVEAVLRARMSTICVLACTIHIEVSNLWDCRIFRSTLLIYFTTKSGSEPFGSWVHFWAILFNPWQLSAVKKKPLSCFWQLLLQLPPQRRDSYIATRLPTSTSPAQLSFPPMASFAALEELYCIPPHSWRELQHFYRKKMRLNNYFKKIKLFNTKKKN